MQERGTSIVVPKKKDNAGVEYDDLSYLET